MRGTTRCIVGVSLWLAATSSAGAQTEPLSLADLERLALDRNPTLAQAESQIDAARGRAVQAGMWPNPSVGYTAEEVSNSATIRGGEHGLFIEQVFPLGGKRGASRAVFERETDRATAVRDTQRMGVLTAVRALYYEALVAARRVDVRDGLAALSREAVDVTRRLANVGAADRPDLLSAEIEAEEAGVALVEARAEETGVWRRLAQVVGNPGLVVTPLNGDADAGLPVIDYDTAVVATLTGSPELAAARAAVERAMAALARAKKEPIPDLVVRGGPRYNRELLDPGPRPVGWEAFLDIGVRLPLWDRNQGAVGAAAADVARARSEITRLELSLRVELSEVFERYSTSAARATTYRDAILPDAAEAHGLFLARYGEMAGAYPQVLIAQRTLFQVTERYLDALADAWRSAVLIEGLLVGGALEAPSSID